MLDIVCDALLQCLNAIKKRRRSASVGVTGAMIIICCVMLVMLQCNVFVLASFVCSVFAFARAVIRRSG